MGFYPAIVSFFKKYIDFDGRSSRSEFWWVYLAVLLVDLTLTLPELLFESSELNVFIGIVRMLFGLGVLLPYIAITVRRFHDVGYSGWWALGFPLLSVLCVALLAFVATLLGIEDFSVVAIVLVIGFAPMIFSIYLWAKKGEEGENRFGADPLEPIEEPES